jgi:putative transposase
MSFMSDTLSDVRKMHLFNVINDCNHQALAINEEDSYLTRTVVETLETLKEKIAKP